MSLGSRDAAQVIKNVHDEANDALNVHVVAGGLTAVDLDVLASINVDFSNIPDNATAPFEIIASLPSQCVEIQLYETTGSRLQLRVGAATGTLKLLVGPGQDNLVPCIIAAGSRVTVRSDEASAPSSGSFIITFLG